MSADKDEALIINAMLRTMRGAIDERDCMARRDVSRDFQFGVKFMVSEGGFLRFSGGKIDSRGGAETQRKMLH